VVIGRGCVLEEGARLVNVGPGVMSVGDGNLFEVGCTVHAQQVGWAFVFYARFAERRRLLDEGRRQISSEVIPETSASMMGCFIFCRQQRYFLVRQ